MLWSWPQVSPLTLAGWEISMKVVVILEIEVDKDAYNREYGREASVADIKYDVRMTAKESVEYQYTPMMFIKSVELRNL